MNAILGSHRGYTASSTPRSFPLSSGSRNSFRPHVAKETLRRQLMLKRYASRKKRWSQTPVYPPLPAAGRREGLIDLSKALCQSIAIIPMGKAKTKKVEKLLLAAVLVIRGCGCRHRQRGDTEVGRLRASDRKRCSASTRRWRGAAPCQEIRDALWVRYIQKLKSSQCQAAPSRCILRPLWMSYLMKPKTACLRERGVPRGRRRNIG